jgi:hypothetical protein
MPSQSFQNGKTLGQFFEQLYGHGCCSILKFPPERRSININLGCDNNMTPVIHLQLHRVYDC